MTGHATSMKKQKFGEIDGAQVDLYTLVNTQGAELTVTNYGGIITSLMIPDKHGALGDVVLGFHELEGYISEAYMAGKPYFGAIVGRYCDRIASGKISLEGKEYQLSRNNGDNTLHGGAKGFDAVVWAAEAIETEEGPAVELTHISPDGDQGFPGNLTMKVRYTLTHENVLKIEYSGTTDAPTVINMTNHSYFNLAGEGSGDIFDHQMMINADSFVVSSTETGLIPTGEIRSLAGTALDLRVSTALGDKIETKSDILPWGGYANNYVLNKEGVDALSLAATVHEPASGRLMQVYTTEPAVMFYSGHFLDGSFTGKSGKRYEASGAFCLETQHFANSPNIPEFPSVELKPGERFKSTTIYQFSIF